jgi:hypothetical protein
LSTAKYPIYNQGSPATRHDNAKITFRCSLNLPPLVWIQMVTASKPCVMLLETVALK